MPSPTDTPITFDWRILRAGRLRLDGGSMFGVVPKPMWSKLVTPDEHNRIPLQTNCLLLKRPAVSDQRSDFVLIESGFGSKWSDKERGFYDLERRDIVDALREIDIAPEQIKHVIVTHLHFDHAAGLTRFDPQREAVPTFANADVFVQRREWDDALANKSTMNRTYLRDHLDPIADRLRLIDGETEALPGITVWPMPGHTWGQQAVRFNDARGTVVFAGDVLPTANHVGLPFSLAYDMEPYTSMLSKKRLYEQAIAHDWRLVLDHEPGDEIVFRVREEADKPGNFTLESRFVNATPRITIITPSFNQARFLNQCIDSVLDQRHSNLQYLVLDGGSTDHTLEVLRGYRDRIVWKSERDRGQSDAVNKGLRAAEGEIIGWLNSDDYYLPDAFARVIETFAKHPNAAMVFGRALMVDERGETMREYPTFDFKHEDLRRKCYVCQPTVFVRKSVLNEVGLLNEHLDICLDYDWWLRISRAHEIAFCDHVLAASRHYDRTKTASRRLRALIEAGYLMREHFGEASWRWSAKWIAHRWTLDRRRFMMPILGWTAAAQSAIRFHRRFDARIESRRPPSRFGRKMIERLNSPPTLRG